MRQRAALIRTMALEPDILLLDEPFSALDYQTRLTVSADIAAMIRKAEKSVILITHDLAEAISLADRVLILSVCPPRPCQSRISHSPDCRRPFAACRTARAGIRTAF